MARVNHSRQISFPDGGSHDTSSHQLLLPQSSQKLLLDESSDSEPPDPVLLRFFVGVQRSLQPSCLAGERCPLAFEKVVGHGLDLRGLDKCSLFTMFSSYLRHLLGT
jgi:hypothetical protein